MILLRKESDDNMTQTTPQVLLYLIRYTKIQHVKNEVMYKKQIHLSKIYIISSQVLD